MEIKIYNITFAHSLEDLVAQPVQARENDVFGTDHQRQEEIPERGRNPGHDEQKNHDHAVGGKGEIIGLGSDVLLPGVRELGAHQQGKEAAEDEEHQHRGQIHQTDPLVVDAHPPGPESPLPVEIVFLRRFPGHSIHRHTLRAF